MRTTSVVATLALGLTISAAPSASLQGRQIAMSCSTRTYNGPLITNPDTVERFKGYAGSVAKVADPSVPRGYKFIDGFIGLEAAAVHPSYMVSMGPEGYKPEQCAEACNLIEGCRSFNIFFERVPLIVDPITLAPNPSICPGKPSSPSATLIRCAFYKDIIQPKDATNTGQPLDEFPVAIAGSSAFQRLPRHTLRGFLGPVDFGNHAIPITAVDYLRREQIGDPSTTPVFNPFLCAISCASQVGGDGRPECVFFNAYVERINFEKGVFTCAYYGRDHGLEEATDVGRVEGDGSVGTVAESLGYSLEEKFREGKGNSTSLG